MKRFGFVIVITVVVIFNSCGTKPMDRIDDGMILSDWSIFKDKQLLSNITNYQDEKLNDGVGVVFVIVKRKKAFEVIVDKYILSSHKNLSSIYNWPFTSYFMHNGQPVLIYFEKGPFLNPRNYPKEIVRNVFTPHLYDDWNRIYNSETKQVESIESVVLLYHPKVWCYKNGVLVTKNYQTSLSKILYGEEDFTFSLYQNMNNYRTDYSKLKKTN